MLKRIKRYFDRRKIVKRWTLFLSIVDLINKKFEYNHTPQWQRKQFWRDIISNPTARKKLLQEIMEGMK
jgi:hypothetical protein